jgi:hypothetical protein
VTGNNSTLLTLLQNFFIFIFEAHPVASITNNLWGCREPQVYFSECFITISYPLYVSVPTGGQSSGGI